MFFLLRLLPVHSTVHDEHRVCSPPYIGQRGACSQLALGMSLRFMNGEVILIGCVSSSYGWASPWRWVCADETKQRDLLIEIYRVQLLYQISK